MMLVEGIPQGERVAQEVASLKPLTYDNKDMLMELFNDLEVARNHMARVCRHLSSLLKILTPGQLMIVLKACNHPMIQLNAIKGFLDKEMVSKCKLELPDYRGNRVCLTMLPDPKADKLKLEYENNPMCLLAATVAYKLTKMFMDGGTQKEASTCIACHGMKIPQRN